MDVRQLNNVKLKWSKTVLLRNDSSKRQEAFCGSIKPV